MAITATATTTTRKNGITTLGLIDPVMILASPDKPNITYTVRDKESIESVFSPLVTQLRASRCRLPRVIVFCRRCEECSELYHFFYSSLKERVHRSSWSAKFSRVSSCEHVHWCNTQVNSRFYHNLILEKQCPTLRDYMCYSLWNGHRLFRCTPSHQDALGGLLQTLSHMSRSVAELAAMVCHQMLCCLGKNLILDFQL